MASERGSVVWLWSCEGGRGRKGEGKAANAPVWTGDAVFYMWWNVGSSSILVGFILIQKIYSVFLSLSSYSTYLFQCRRDWESETCWHKDTPFTLYTFLESLLHRFLNVLFNACIHELFREVGWKTEGMTKVIGNQTWVQKKLHGKSHQCTYPTSMKPFELR